LFIATASPSELSTFPALFTRFFLKLEYLSRNIILKGFKLFNLSNNSNNFEYYSKKIYITFK